MYYFERAAETYIRALQTGRSLGVLPDAVAEKTAHDLESYAGQSEQHLVEMMDLLVDEGSSYAT